MKVIQKENVALAGLIGTILLAGGLLTIPGVVAGTDAVDEITITVPPSCSLSSTGGDSHTAEILNGQTNSNVGESTIKAYCNDNNGFSIYAIGYTDNELGKTVLTSSTLGSTHDILTGTNTTGNSSWAMKLSTITSPEPTYPLIIAGSEADTDKEQEDPDYTSFQEIPDDYTLVAKRKSNTDTGENAEGATLKTTYQVNISNTQSAGTYTGQVKYTMVHPYNHAAPEIPINMQQLNSTAMATLLPEIGSTAKVYDARDEQTYTIGKLADNKYWMLDNLRLNIADQTVQARLNSQNTNASDTTLDYLINGGGTSSDGYATSGVSDWPESEYSYSVPFIVASQANESITNDSGEESKIGVFYNYCAASAGSYCYGNNDSGSGDPLYRNATEDICPLGWRMPSAHYNVGEYTILSSNYDNQNAFRASLATSLAGRVYNGQPYGQGSEGHYWSNTYSYSTGMYELAVYSSYIGTGYSYDRYYGNSIRCVWAQEQYTLSYDTNGGTDGPVTQVQTDMDSTAFVINGKTPTRGGYYFVGWSTEPTSTTAQYWSGSTFQTSNKTNTLYAVWNKIKTIADSTTMQEVNRCPSTLETGRIYTLIDERDDIEYSVAKLADGECWMLDNLKLNIVNQTIQEKMTDQTTNASNSTLNYLKGVSVGTTSDRFATSAVNYSYNYQYRYSYSDPLINTSLMSQNVTGNSKYGDGKGYYGIYYNFCAASAGSQCQGNGIESGSNTIYYGNASEDICPKGWRLPYYSMFSTLYSAYNNKATETMNALALVLSGYEANGSLYNLGMNGSVWSSNVRSDYSSLAYRLYYGKEPSFNKDSYVGRAGGSVIRCVLK